MGDDGKKPEPYLYTFEDACKRAEEIDVKSITKTKFGYSLRTSMIPIKVGIKKGFTKLSHPERSISSWKLKSDIPYPHELNVAVKDKKVASRYEIENLTFGMSYMSKSKPKRKPFNVKKPEPEPEPEPEEEEEDTMLEEITFEGKEYYVDNLDNVYEHTKDMEEMCDEVIGLYDRETQEITFVE